MGDVSRHRDIFLFTREAVPRQLLEHSRLTTADLSYLELGNYLTDVSQFRDPVMYIFAKQRIWREKVLPQAGDKLLAARIIAALVGAASLAASQYLKDRASGTLSDAIGYGGAGLAALGGLAAVLPTDTYADLFGADDWIDAMFGTPIERTPGDPKRREEKHYGFVGQFFRHFLEGVSHLLFAQEVRERVRGEWGRVSRIPESRLSEVFAEFFTQYYPHEHTDQPPYVWDASARPAHPMYQPSRRQRSLQDPDIGVMNAVDVHYVGYLAEELTDLEQRWRTLRPADVEGRQRTLVRMAKLLHGIEDWYFHSNVVEILKLRDQPQGAGQGDEEFLRAFVEKLAKTEPEFLAATDPGELRRLKRKLHRRLRFPAYERGTRTQSGGRLSTRVMSAPSFRHAYPAFPSQQDTAHTLLHALENLEHKITHPALAQPGQHLREVLAKGLPEWVPCVMQRFVDADDGRKLLEQRAAARGVDATTMAAALINPGQQRVQVRAVIVDVLREWVPLVVTLLDESERQRLLADFTPANWPPADASRIEPGRQMGKTQLDEQVKLHQAALKPRKTDGNVVEHNYARLIRYLTECGFLNIRGRQALERAFEIDRTSEELPTDAPGAGGTLIQFAVELQQLLDAGDAATVKLNRDNGAVFGQASDNGAFNEIVGSHSLMSKDTLASTPFFDETRVLATVASSSVFTIMLEQVTTPSADRRLVWTDVLHHFIRYPPRNGGWERRAIAFFRENGKIPTYGDLPELARLAQSAMRPPPAAPAARKQTKRAELEERYLELEVKLSRYRYPNG